MKRFALTSIFVSFLSTVSLAQGVLFSSDEIQAYSPAVKEIENLRRNGDFGDAIALLVRYLEGQKKDLAIKEKKNLIALSGLLNWNIGQPGEAKKYFEKAYDLAFDDSAASSIYKNAVEFIDKYNQAKNLLVQAEFRKSIAVFQEAINLAKSLKLEEFEAKALRQLSLVYWDMEDLDSFFALNEDALALARKLRFFRDESSCLNNIGLFHSRMDNYSQAAKYCEEALALARKIGYFRSQSDCLTNLGVLHQDIGEYEKAFACFFEALGIDEAHTGREFVLIDLNNIGTAYRKRGQTTSNLSDLREALKYFRKSLDLLKDSTDLRSKIRVLNNIATIYSDLSEFTASLRYYNEALEIAKSRNDTAATSSVLNNIGIVYNSMGNFDQASQNLKEAIELGEKIKSNRIQWEAYFEIANTYKKQGFFDKAFDYYTKSIDIIEKARSSIDSEELKATFLASDKRLDAYHQTIDLLFQRSDPDLTGEIIDYFERSKARAFLDSLEISKISLDQGMDPALLNKEKEISTQLEAAYRGLNDPAAGSTGRTEIQSNIDRLEGDYERLKGSIRAADPKYADLKFPEVITRREIQDSLLDDTSLILAYSIGKSASYAIALCKKECLVFPLLPRKELQVKIGDYLRSISNPENQLSPSARDLGRELFNILVNPARIAASKKLIIIPDDLLYYFPFETLISGDNWLINDIDISYAPSISSLRSLKGRYTKADLKNRLDLIAFGNPENKIEYSAVEIQKIQAFFPPRKRATFTGKAASEKSLKSRNLKEYKIIHFAAHGIIDDQKPGRSSVVLSAGDDSPEDGNLQAREIYNLALRADLVTLSACESGLGRFIRGEGIEGLNRAFFYAGASSVLMSLWAVNDQAGAYLMERFYYYLTSSSSIASALQKAKIDMIQSKEYSHPYFWAPFIVAGNADRVIFLKRASIQIFGLIILVISGALIFWIIVVKKRIFFR